MKARSKKLLLLVVVLLLAAFYGLGLQDYLDLEVFQRSRDMLTQFLDDHLLLGSLVYFFTYVVVTALSLPFAAVLTIVGGALFGFWRALLLVSFASTLGATLAFLLARTLLRDWVQQKFSAQLEPINHGIEKDGIFYLFTLRLVPLFPFVLVNLAMGLTPISTFSFYWVSQLGMLLGTALFVEVGVQLGLATSIPGVFSIGVIRAIVILSLFPWFTKLLLNWLRARRIMRRYAKPKKFDANLVVIGAGSAGLVTANIAAMAQARVILVEKHRMGGDCLNTGCVPSKALLRSADLAYQFGRAGEFGIDASNAKVDFRAVMERVRAAIRRIEPHDSVARYAGLGVECVLGEATILSPWLVAVDGKEITTRNIVLATGAKPVIPEIPGLATVPHYTSDTIWDLEELPQRLLVLGGGPIGCELAQAFARLGSKVTIVNNSEYVLSREDPEVAALLETQLRKEGIAVRNNSTVDALRSGAGSNLASIVCQSAQASSGELEFDILLLALGRTPNTAGLGLEQLGLELNNKTGLELNEYLQTSCPNIYACGDLAGPWQFTHMAAFQAWYASINSLFGTFRKFRVNYRVVPRVTFTDPEIARVGLNEKEAIQKSIPHEVTVYMLAELDRAIADGDNRGFIKVLSVPGSDRILGVSIAAPHAGELLNEFVFAMTHGLGLKKILSTIHVYPTWGEANKYLAGEWRRQHAPAWLFPWLRRWHRFRRGDSSE